MHRYLLSIILLLLISFCQQATAVIWDDNGTHNVTTVFQGYITIRGNTTVNIFETAVINGGLSVYNQGYANIYGGMLNGDIGARDNSKIYFENATALNLSAYDNSYVKINGGVFNGNYIVAYADSKICFNNATTFSLNACERSHIEINGGSPGFVIADQSATISITSGEIRDNLWAKINSSVGISGGNFAGDFFSDGQSCITFRGYDFAIDGQTVRDGTYATEYQLTSMIFDDGYNQYPCLTGTLTGTLSDGSHLNNTFHLIDYYDKGKGNMQFSIVPEPATITLLLLGSGLILRRKRL